MAANSCSRSGAGVGRFAGQQLVHHHAQRIQVAGRLQLVALHLLGRHVQRRADGMAPASATAVRVVDLGDGEIHHLGHAVRRHHDVTGLDVAVEDALGVRILQRLGALEDDVHHLVDRQARTVLLAGRHQGVALDVLHHQVVHAGFDAGIVERDDMRVAEHAGGMRLGEKGAPDRLLVVRVVLGEAARGFHRHIAAHEGVEALVDEAAGPLADQLVDFVLADLFRQRRLAAAGCGASRLGKVFSTMDAPRPANHMNY